MNLIICYPLLVRVAVKIYPPKLEVEIARERCRRLAGTVKKICAVRQRASIQQLMALDECSDRPVVMAAFVEFHCVSVHPVGSPRD